jgi:hypothetical protein
MTNEQREQLAAAAERYLLARGSTDHEAAGAALLAILQPLLAQENALALCCGGWLFVPFPRPDGNTLLYALPESQVIGLARIG